MLLLKRYGSLNVVHIIRLVLFFTVSEKSLIQSTQYKTRST